MRLEYIRPVVFAVARLPRSPGPGFDVHGPYTVVGFGPRGDGAKGAS